jgi:hypothetical protein
LERAQNLKEIMKPFTNSMTVQCPPRPLSGLSLAVLNGTEPSEYRESLETSLETARMSSPDLPQQTAITRETVHPDGKATPFAMISIVLGRAKSTVAEQYTR